MSGEQSTAVWTFALTALTILGAWFTKEKYDAKEKVSKVAIDKESSQMDQAERTLALMERVLTRIEQDSHDCEEELKKVREELKVLSRKMGAYEKMFPDVDFE